MTDKKWKNKHHENTDVKKESECGCKCGEKCNCEKDKCASGNCECGKDCKCHHEHHCNDCGEGVECPANGCEKEFDKIENLKAEVASWQEKYIRTLADCENAKRRADIDAKNMVDYKIAKFAKDMLPLADNIALALASIEGKVDSSVIEGLKSIQSGFISALEKNNICKIKTVGEKLNPQEHCVVMQVDDPKVEEGVVARELQAGYKLGDKVIREAMVATSNGKKN